VGEPKRRDEDDEFDSIMQSAEGASPATPAPQDDFDTILRSAQEAPEVANVPEAEMTVGTPEAVFRNLDDSETLRAMPEVAAYRLGDSSPQALERKKRNETALERARLEAMVYGKPSPETRAMYDAAASEGYPLESDARYFDKSYSGQPVMRDRAERAARSEGTRGGLERMQANADAQARVARGEDASAVFDKYAQAGDPLESDERFQLYVPGSIKREAPEEDSLSRTLRDDAAAGSQAAWLGFGDSVVGAAGQLMDDPHAGQRFRDRVEVAKERSPKSTLATEIGVGALSSALVPGAASGRAALALGAGQGALANVGYSDPQSLGEAADKALQGGTLGLAAGLPFVVGGRGAQAIGEGLEGTVAPAARRARNTSNVQHVMSGPEFGALAGNSRDGVERVQELGQFMHDEGLMRGVPGTGTVMRRAKAVEDAALPVRQGVINEATERGVTVPSRKIINEVLDEAKASHAEFPSESGKLATKLEAEAKRLGEKTRVVESDYYHVDPARQHDSVYLSTDYLNPEEVEAGVLSRVGGVSNTPVIGELFKGRYVVEAPRDFAEATGKMVPEMRTVRDAEGKLVLEAPGSPFAKREPTGRMEPEYRRKPQVENVNYGERKTGAGAGQDWFKDSMRALRRVTEPEKKRVKVAGNVPGATNTQLMHELASSATPSAESAGHPTLPQSVADMIERYGTPSVRDDAATEGDHLADALFSHFKTRARKARAEEDLSFAKKDAELADTEAAALQGADPRKAARAEVASGKRQLATTKKQAGATRMEQQDLVFANKAAELAEAEIQARKLDPDAAKEALATITAQKRLLAAAKKRAGATRIEGQVPLAKKGAELAEAGAQAQQPALSTRDEVLADIAKQRNELTSARKRAQIARMEEDAQLEAAGESRRAVTAALESAAERRLHWARGEQEALPVVRKSPTDVHGELKIPKDRSRIFPRDANLHEKVLDNPEAIPGYGTARISEKLPSAPSALSAVELAGAPIYGREGIEMAGGPIPGSEMVDRDVIPIADAINAKQQYDSHVQWEQPGGSRDDSMTSAVNRLFGGKFRESVKESLGAQAPDLLEPWNNVQTRIGNAKSIQQPAAARYWQGHGKQPIDLGTLAASGGGLPGMVAAALAKARPRAIEAKLEHGLSVAAEGAGKLLKKAPTLTDPAGASAGGYAGRKAAAAMATASAEDRKRSDGESRGHLTADAAKQLLATNPAALGGYRGAWEKAVAGGPQAVAALMAKLEHDSVYSATVKRALQAQTKRQ